MAANRIVLNTVSYHGSGAIEEIPGIAEREGFTKVFVATDPDLIKFGVAGKVTDLLEKAGIEYVLYSDIKPN
ncbi:MAG: iron-containing alcohol dehydrogenase, partial [Peptoniphilaceae bacterium]|nr:iron-containing alcohol dehydrogenase [Peptoniphilaceae bacterium]